MKRAFAIASMFAASVAWGQDVSFKHTEIVDGLYVIEGVGGFGGGNMGLSVGEDGVVLIDDSVPPLAEKLVAAIAEITDQPVDFVVNTHVHGDHIGANELLAASGTTVVAHDNIRKRLVENGIRVGGAQRPAPKGMLPVLTFSDAVTFHLNGHEAYVFHVERAHTDGDAIIHYRSIDVIHSGDVLFNGIFPFIDLDNGGTVDGFIAAQERIVATAGPDTQIIAGHGPMATRDDVQASIDMLKTARSRVAEHMAAGKSVDEIVAADPLADYESWNWQFITAERMVRTIHRSLSE
ncbi:MAG: MBL fold metallo-hydrolase [Pseudomonadota bacterium]